jgi:hypothetical protein
MNRATTFEETMAIELPPHQVPFVPKGFAYKMMEGIQFHGMDKESPQEHIEDFIQVCRTLRTPEVSDEIIRLTMFPLTLAGDAKKWLRNCPHGAYNSWEGLRDAFLEKFFPADKVQDAIDACYLFKEKEGETFAKAWERFQQLSVVRRTTSPQIQRSTSSTKGCPKQCVITWTRQHPEVKFRKFPSTEPSL